MRSRKKKDRKEYLLKLWKIRQEKEGYDVSNVKTLEQAEKFFAKKSDKKTNSKRTTARNTTAKKEV